MICLIKIPSQPWMAHRSILAQGSYLETVCENALWDYNRSRAHDGLPPLDELPRGTSYEPMTDDYGKPMTADMVFRLQRCAQWVWQDGELQST